jgi:hypothetical protein
MSRNTGIITTTLLAASIGLIGAGGAAVAQPGWMGAPGGSASRGPAAFSAMDSDGDGAISAAEHAAFRAERIAANAAAGRALRNVGNAPAFEDIDANGDGELSQAELGDFRSARMAARGGNAGRGCNGQQRARW